MQTELLVHSRVVYSKTAFVESMLRRGPSAPEMGASSHRYHLKYVVDGSEVVSYDNESTTGHRRHFGTQDAVYLFTTPERLEADFQGDIARWNDENGNS